jgi:hypothetical protein
MHRIIAPLRRASGRTWRGMKAVGFLPVCLVATAVGYLWVAHSQFHNAAGSIVAQDVDAAAWFLMSGPVWLVMGLGLLASAFIVARRDLSTARGLRIAARTEELANGGSLSGDELSDLAASARLVHDTEESEALSAAARWVDQRSNEREHQAFVDSLDISGRRAVSADRDSYYVLTDLEAEVFWAVCDRAGCNWSGGVREENADALVDGERHDREHPVEAAA